MQIKVSELWRVVTSFNNDSALDADDYLFTKDEADEVCAEYNKDKVLHARSDWVVQSLEDAVNEYGDLRAYNATSD